MKITCLLTMLATSTAFTLVPQTRTSSSLSAKPAKAAPKTISKMIFDMDLFKDKSTQNDYGARGAKKITLGKIQAGKSYVPSGLTAAQFDAKRKADKAKKDAGYKRNVAKAGVFEDYTAFYTKRGTDTNSDWKKSVTLGHRMAKTKYDYGADSSKYAKTFESSVSGKRQVGKKATAGAAATGANSDKKPGQWWKK